MPFPEDDAAELALADAGPRPDQDGCVDLGAPDDVAAATDFPPLPPAIVSALVGDISLFSAESDVPVDNGLLRADLVRGRTGDAVEERSPDDPADDDPAADEPADAPDEPAPAEAPEPSVACATPDPLTRAAPTPSVIAPAPSHAYGSIRRSCRLPRRPLLPVVFTPDAPGALRRPATRSPQCSVKLLQG